jgi:hypothetical protein
VRLPQTFWLEVVPWLVPFLCRSLAPFLLKAGTVQPTRLDGGRALQLEPKDAALPRQAGGELLLNILEEIFEERREGRWAAYAKALQADPSQTSVFGPVRASASGKVSWTSPAADGSDFTAAVVARRLLKVLASAGYGKAIEAVRSSLPEHSRDNDARAALALLRLVRSGLHTSQPVGLEQRSPGSWGYTANLAAPTIGTPAVIVAGQTPLEYAGQLAYG